MAHSSVMDWGKFPVIYNDNVKADIHEAKNWFTMECYPSQVAYHSEELRINLADEIFDMRKDIKLRYLTHAIYVLFFYGYIRDPFFLSFEDIENARWLIKNSDYGYPESPPNEDVKKMPISFFKI